MPMDAWLLLIAAVGLGAALEVAFYRGRLRDRRRSSVDAGGADVGAPPPANGGDA